MHECEKRDTQALVSTQAAEWFVLLRDGDLSEGEQRRYLDWLKQSPTHAAAMAHLEQLYSILKSMFLGFK